MVGSKTYNYTIFGDSVNTGETKEQLHYILTWKKSDTT